MRIISKGPLRKCWEQHRDSEKPLKAWYQEVKNADWDSPAKLKERFGNASFVGNNRVVFNIKGNKYRLVARIDFRGRVVYVRFVGTHTYDQIDANEV